MHGGELGYFEPDAGFVYPEACIAAQLSTAKAQGAESRLDEKVLRWELLDSGVRVLTERGQYEGSRLILCSGAWIRELLPELSASIQPFRQVQFWFKPEGPPGHFAPDQMPVFIRVPDAATEMFYGFPAVPGSAGGLKLAGEQFVTSTQADALERGSRAGGGAGNACAGLPTCPNIFALPAHRRVPLHRHAGFPFRDRSSPAHGFGLVCLRLLRPRIQTFRRGRRDTRRARIKRQNPV